MKILTGKQQQEIEAKELAERVEGHFPIHIDVGTGSGRLMLKQSIKNPGGFYIGMDPSVGSMCENSVKAVKQARKEGLSNLLFVIGAIEAAPDGLTGLADIVSVILPWGSLRDGIVNADFPILRNLRKLGKAGTVLEALVGYDEKNESCEMEKRSLPVLSREHFAAIAPLYGKAGIEMRSIDTIGNEEMKTMESDWAKKLAYGGTRVMYKLKCVYI